MYRPAIGVYIHTPLITHSLWIHPAHSTHLAFEIDVLFGVIGEVMSPLDGCSVASLLLHTCVDAHVVVLSEEAVNVEKQVLLQPSTFEGHTLSLPINV